MKRKIILTSMLAAVILCGFMINSIFASGSTPGSSGDPLVSKSYVDDRFNQLMSMVNQMGTSDSGAPNPVASYEGSTEEIVNKVVTQLEYVYGLTPGAVSVGEIYEPVFAFAGQYIIGHEGTEIILRSGRAISYCPGENGLINITKGTETYANENIEANNLIIVPRSDGRGVKATTDAWFMVRGGFDIHNL